MTAGGVCGCKREARIAASRNAESFNSIRLIQFNSMQLDAKKNIQFQFNSNSIPIPIHFQFQFQFKFHAIPIAIATAIQLSSLQFKSSQFNSISDLL